MTGKYFNLCLTASTLLGSFIIADETPLPSLPQETAPSFKTGIEAFRVHYPTNSSYDHNNTGYYTGVRFDHEERSPNALYYSLEHVLAVSKSEYRNEWLGWDFYRKHLSKTAVWLNVDLKYGYTFQPAVTKTFLLSVFAGPGYHFEVCETQRAFWWHGLAGIRATQEFSEQFSLGLDFKTTYAFSVKDEHNFARITHRDRDEFWGLDVGLPLTWKMGTTNRFDLQFRPYLLKLNLNSTESIIGSTFELGYTF